MTSAFVVQIQPKKPAFDPVAGHVRTELIDEGQPPASAVVETRRLYRLEGALSAADVQRIAATLLVDPVVEAFEIEGAENGAKGKRAKGAGKTKGGFVLDVWPKPGVTDPVGETVAKGVRDLGFPAGTRASSAMRYLFPKITDAGAIETLAKRALANELIHDIRVRAL